MTNERHYCLEKIKKSKDYLLSVSEKIIKLRSGYDKYKDSSKELDYLTELYKTVKNLHNEFIILIQSLNELEETDLLETAKRINVAIRKFKFLEQDYNKLCGALVVFAKTLPEENSINSAALGRLMNRVKIGYFPTDENHVKLIKSAIEFPHTRVNILDPCCGCGEALRVFTDNENTATYGIELDRSRAVLAETKLYRVGYGSFFHSRISNRAFHCVFLNPPYLSVMREGGGNQRAERSFLLESLRYLSLGGILVYIIPFYRLTADICTILAENFEDIRIYRFLEYEFKKFKQVVIFGKLKRREDKMEKESQGLLNLSLNVESISLISELPQNIYSLNNKEIEINQFKGAEFNVNELAVQLKKSNSLKTLFKKSQLDTMHRNPLLPLKTGQIGLIGGSGLMNGLIECNNPHIIKGRIIKTMTTVVEENYNAGTKEIRETISNRMVFNVLTPDGFKTLT